MVCKHTRGFSPAYVDSSSGSLTDSPKTGVSGGTSYPLSRPPSAFKQPEAFPVPVLWYANPCLHESLNPVPSSTFSPGGFSPATIPSLSPDRCHPCPFPELRRIPCCRIPGLESVNKHRPVGWFLLQTFGASMVCIRFQSCSEEQILRLNQPAGTAIPFVNLSCLHRSTPSPFSRP